MSEPTSAAWAALREVVRPRNLRALFAADPGRATRYLHTVGDLRVDWSKHLIDDEVLARLVDLASAAGVERRRDAMFSGAVMNSTEQRAALHVALRAPRTSSIEVDGVDVVPRVHQVRERMAVFAERIRSGEWRGATGQRITSVVNVGIGGSDLGPAMAVAALRPYVDPHLDLRFVSNVDGADVRSNLAGLDPQTTLVIVSSKTFTTLETLTNARVVRRWLTDSLGPDAVARHVVAVTTNTDAARDFGIETDNEFGGNTFGFWDWVGGRYSVDSAIGLSLMVGIGAAAFDEFLGGFRIIDEHFCTAPIDANVPILMAMLGVWYHSVLGAESRAVLPYSHDLRRFPAFLQQLDMESNGKSVRNDGAPVTTSTGPIVWGEPGTNGQHAFFQLLHQGTHLVPVDFIGFARSAEGLDDQHDLLIANMFAQGEALAFGRTAAEVESAGVPAHQRAHRVFPGSRPSTTILAPALTPSVLGQLIALYEHIVFVQGIVWEINSFDQWGVELGKELATSIVEDITSPSDRRRDASTAGLIDWYRAHRR